MNRGRYQIIFNNVPSHLDEFILLLEGPQKVVSTNFEYMLKRRTAFVSVPSRSRVLKHADC